MQADHKFHIVTYGCQMNEAESQRIKNALITNYKLRITNLEDADLIVINSCSVRQGSEDKVYGLGQKIIPLKSQKQKANSQRPFVILIGCMVGSARGERRRYELSKLKRKMPWVDEFLTFEELVESLVSSRKALGTTASRTVKDPYLIPISQGCDNFCTYCVVPYSRGKEVSRPEKEVLCEIEKAVEAGHSHIMLLGQNVNSWGRDNEKMPEELPFSRLLKKVHQIEEVKKISFLTLNPYDINDELIETLALPKIDRYIHLPVQSGDNDVLARMNRHYTAEEYKDIVKRVRAKIPSVRIGTDIIVGFPGETRQAFGNTLKLVKEIGFKQVFIGIYSPREGTVAAKFKDSVPLAEKKIRHAKLLKVWKKSL